MCVAPSVIRIWACVLISKIADKAPYTSSGLLGVFPIRRTLGYSATNTFSLRYACDKVGRGLSSPFPVSGTFSPIFVK